MVLNLLTKVLMEEKVFQVRTWLYMGNFLSIHLQGLIRIE